MQIPKTSELMEVYCDSLNKKGHRCGRYLGRFQVEGTRVYGDYTCANCKATTQLYVDEFGTLIRDRIQENVKLRAPLTPVFIGG